MEEDRPPPGTPVPPLTGLYRVFFWIGLFSFGGGLSQWLHREIVEIRGWITREQFLSSYAVSQILPGVNSTNLAIFLGQRIRGLAGAIVALAGMLTAPVAFALAAAYSYELLLSIPAVIVALGGVAAAATGMLLRLAIFTAGAGARNASAIAVVLAIFVTVGILQWPILAVLAVAVPVSVALAWPRTKPDA